MKSGTARRAVCLGSIVLLLVLSISACQRSKPPRAALPAGYQPTMVVIAPAATQAMPVVQKQIQAVTPTLFVPPTISSATATVILPSPTLAAPTSVPASPTAPAAQPTLTPVMLIITATATANPTAAPNPTAPPPPAGDVTHVVGRGESLTGIAARYQTTIPVIMSKNNLANPNAIYVGQQLVIPVGQTQVAPGTAITPTVQTIQHVVRAGETLSAIARRYHTSVADIKAQNPSLTSTNTLYAGTVLTVRVGTAPQGAQVQVITHVVRRGESLTSIARRYGVSVRALLQANPMANPNRVYTGQVLIIPSR